jgi:hypothetical protein
MDTDVPERGPCGGRNRLASRDFKGGNSQSHLAASFSPRASRQHDGIIQQRKRPSFWGGLRAGCMSTALTVLGQGQARCSD